MQSNPMTNGQSLLECGIFTAENALIRKGTVLIKQIRILIYIFFCSQKKDSCNRECIISRAKFTNNKIETTIWLNAPNPFLLFFISNNIQAPKVLNPSHFHNSSYQTNMYIHPKAIHIK